MPSPSSSAQEALEALGVRLREIRIEARLTGRGLSRLIGWHSSKVSKIEHGRQAPSADDILVWCAQCGANGDAPDLIASLRAMEGMFVEWRRMERTGLRLAQESVVPLWERTRRFRFYSSWLIPGPFQTGPYIRALLSAIRTQRDLPDDIEAAVEVRVDKQHVLYEGDHRFAVILEESVLRHQIGGADTMAGQLGHLLSAASLPSMSLGVIPLNTDRSALWPVEGFFLYDDEQVNAELSGLAVTGAAARALIAAAIEAVDARP